MYRWSRWFLTVALCLLAVWLPQPRANAAQPVYLFLQANGSEIQGESQQVTLGRAGAIECLSYEQSVLVPFERNGAIATGRRQYAPIRITKRIDKSSPLLFKALTDNAVVEGEFRFYRLSPTGDGTTEQYYTVSFQQGRVASVKQVSPDALSPATAEAPPVEEVTFSFAQIGWRYENGGIEHEDFVTIRR
ncbi:MAG TPA: type VI secretion system tube protein Hcp [Synechococcales cyanobacterium M55_K2018_004]|nr:type VI secretion system tube protein Hcp [Synechococcales cyanobacterium M55_K2018_004]